MTGGRAILALALVASSSEAGELWTYNDYGVVRRAMIVPERELTRDFSTNVSRSFFQEFPCSQFSQLYLRRVSSTLRHPA